MSRKMIVGKNEYLVTETGHMYAAQFMHSKADGLTWDIKDNHTKELFAQSVWSYDALYKARKDCRKTFRQMISQFGGRLGFENV